MKNIECPENPEMQEDIEDLVMSFSMPEGLQGTRVLVTGATGLLGCQLVRTLACFNRLKDTGIHVLAYVRNEKKAKGMFAGLLERGDVSLVVGDIDGPLPELSDVDYIIHGASATSSRYFVSNPVETIKTAIDGTLHILEYAKGRPSVKGMVYLSSLEVYGTPSADKETIGEEDYGYIDPVKVRSSYSEGKRMVECICASYADEYHVPVKIARLSQTFGPGVAYDDGRVFAEFTRCAIEGRDIVLHTQGNTVRSYCYTKDAVSALLYILIAGEAGQAYNVTNMETAVSIREMGELVCRELGDSKISVKVEIPEDVSSFGYNPEMVIRLDSSKLEGLGWKATTKLPTMFLRMSRGMKRQKGGNV